MQWGVTYPFDVIKSRIQTLPDEAPAHARSVFRTARSMYAEAGYRCFFVGLSTTLVRAVPTNAITFLMYEMSLKQLNKFVAAR